jgi:hypothetical protein
MGDEWRGIGKNKSGREAGVEHVNLAAYRCSVLCKRSILDEEKM